MGLKKIVIFAGLSLCFLFIVGCKKSDSTKANGSSSSNDWKSKILQKVDIGPYNKDLAEKGKQIFDSKCAVCHKWEERYTGPALKGVTQRRKPEWIMNMILHPEIMIQNDETAKKLLAEIMVPMANQNLTEQEARSVLEYFRGLDGAK